MWVKKNIFLPNLSSLFKKKYETYMCVLYPFQLNGGAAVVCVFSTLFRFMCRRHGGRGVRRIEKSKEVTP